MTNSYSNEKCSNNLGGGASGPVITVSAYGMSFLDVSTMFLLRRLQTENTVYMRGRSHTGETEPALE